jgi:hypothetical protein
MIDPCMSFLERLVTQSSLTRRQLESLTSYVRVVSGEIRLKDAASIASPGRRRGTPTKPLTVGSYYRTVSQARKNVEQSLVTIVIGLRLNLLKVEDVRRLFDLVGSGARELTDEDSARFVGLLEALLRRMIL